MRPGTGWTPHKHDCSWSLSTKMSSRTQFENHPPAAVSLFPASQGVFVGTYAARTVCWDCRESQLSQKEVKQSSRMVLHHIWLGDLGAAPAPHHFAESFFFSLLYFLTLQYSIGFAMYQHESTTGIHLFPSLYIFCINLIFKNIALNIVCFHYWVFGHPFKICAPCEDLSDLTLIPTLFFPLPGLHYWCENAVAVWKAQKYQRKHHLTWWNELLINISWAGWFAY